MAKRALPAVVALGVLLLVAATVWWVWLRPSTSLVAPEGRAQTCGPVGPPPQHLKMFATQVITNNGDEALTVDEVTFPGASGATVRDWFLVPENYPLATEASPNIPLPPTGNTPTLDPGQTKRVAVVLEVSGASTTSEHLTITYHEENGREGRLTPHRELLPLPHGQDCGDLPLD